MNSQSLPWKRGQAELKVVLGSTTSVLERVLNNYKPTLKIKEVGTVISISHGIAYIEGLFGVKAEELIYFPGDRLGLTFNLDPETVGVILLDEGDDLRAGCQVHCTGRVFDVPVGKGLLGRVVDAMGRPLDNQGPIHALERRPVEREAPAIMDRAPVTIPLETGIKVVDALVPIGRGQRELILGDRQTGKSALALDIIINQRGKDIFCIYCVIGQRESAVAKMIADLREYQAMEYCTVVVATGEDPPGLQFVAPYAATTMAEYFMEQGQDVLIVYDNLTRHAEAYRELSLLLRRPPGREAYPGDIFYIHSRLLERSTHLCKERGGGSLTALPIIETQAQNISDYIPTNLISITDGQIFLSPSLFQKGSLPAIDVGRSVSRVGGKAQLPAYRAVAGDLRLSYSQFQELETFSRFGTRLDQETRRVLNRGYRVREILKQPQYEPAPVPEQIAVLLAVTEGIFDGIPLDQIGQAEKRISRATVEQLPDLCQRIRAGEILDDHARKSLLGVAKQALEARSKDIPDANA